MCFINIPKINLLLFVLAYVLLFIPKLPAQELQLQHAKSYHENIAVTDYFVSEKLDGVRAYWDGNKLLSRNGLLISVPAWFIKGFPNFPLDGELWIGRGEFEQTVSIVSQLSSSPTNDIRWQKMRFMIFDLPEYNGDFTARVKAMKDLVRQVHSPYLQMIAQQKIQSRQHLQELLDDVVKNGGEGLMLHRANAIYVAGRNNNVLKLKPHFDAEAVVVAHLPGQGKFSGMLGSLLVENSEGIRFKVGTGFSNEQRLNPPQVGSIITYKYWGYTKTRVPRFASFLRQRKHF
ncbi:DNA ligase [Thalassomonas sp. M1454]|uniref:DNA ligase n=1 Tax=Thalassomonas sp. M1454 TaxID=2594477 RepID=UPI00163D837E|nr:DNA ligase [Thalassomonas sp. M1454]